MNNLKKIASLGIKVCFWKLWGIVKLYYIYFGLKLQVLTTVQNIRGKNVTLL